MKREILKGMLCLLVVGVAVVMMADNVSAYKYYCLNYGEELNERYTCFHTTCYVCTTDLGNPTLLRNCRNINECIGLDGSSGGGGGTIDAEAPVITLHSPEEGGVYDSRKVLFHIETNEPGRYTYTDNIRGRGRLKNMASNVFEYIRSLSFKDGLNDITVFAKDRNGNTAEKRVTFFVDSKRPRIGKTLPKGNRAFANGDFYVEFKEDNPEDLVLAYGNGETGFREADVDLDECSTNRGRHYCSVYVDLRDYDGEIISYVFELTDISGKSVESRKVLLPVDNTSPVVVNEDSFWEQGSGRNARYIYFDFEIDEDNFDEITYIDNEGRGRERRLCSRLRDDRCVKRVSFRPGYHELDILVKDKAGNFVGYTIDFEV